MTDLLQFNYNDTQDTIHIKIKASKLDTSNIDAFRDTIIQSWNPTTRRVTIDCSELDFIDSSEIGALLSIRKRLSAKSEPIALLNVHANVVTIIELLRLHRVFDIRGLI